MDTVKDKMFERMLAFEAERVFITREFLDCGNRGSIDKVMCKLVKDEVLQRLAWGVFRLSEKFLEKALPFLSDEEIAEAKSLGFDRRLQSTLAIEEVEVTHIPVTGKSTRFRRLFEDRSHYRYVLHKGLSPKKASLAGFTFGARLLQLWRLGKRRFNLLEKPPLLPDLSEVPEESEKLVFILPNWLKKLVISKQPLTTA